MTGPVPKPKPAREPAPTTWTTVAVIGIICATLLGITWILATQL